MSCDYFYFIKSRITNNNSTLKIMNTQKSDYQFFVKEISNLDFDNNGNPGTHWEALRSHNLANGDTWYDILGYGNTEAETKAILALHMPVAVKKTVSVEYMEEGIRHEMRYTTGCSEDAARFAAYYRPRVGNGKYFSVTIN